MLDTFFLTVQIFFDIPVLLKLKTLLRKTMIMNLLECVKQLVLYPSKITCKLANL